MKSYERPVVLANEELAEGVYAASGAVDEEPYEPSVPQSSEAPGDENTESQETGSTDNGAGNTDVTDNGPKCDSKYMQGVWQAPDYSNWNGGTRGYKQQFACLGCPANTDNGCGLQTHYVESGNASSYDVDNGNRKPSWEKKGYGPDDVVADWAM